MIPQKKPFTIAFTKTTPDIPGIGKFLFISEISSKTHTSSAGGKVGITKVNPKRQKKDMIKIRVADIFIDFYL
jgi:hypothetical protein